MRSDEETTRTDRLAGLIAEAVLSGEFAQGERLDEHSLARKYDVSRTPVREALRQVAATGLIEIRPRRGAIVTRTTRERLETMFVAMGEMEATCARLAALGMSPIERRRLQALHDRMGELAASGDVEAYTEANARFHAAIYSGSHNALVEEMTLALRRRLAPFRSAQFRVAGRLALSHGEHDRVVKAITAADATKAHAAMLHHVNLVEEAFEHLASENAA
jgi:DNA-binding GntR family transcriptional regulator